MNHEYQREYWNNFAANGEKNTLSKDLHPSWDEGKQEYTEIAKITDTALDILKKETKMQKALDFGVGMGRNFDYLKENFKGVMGYDIPPMIERISSTRQNFGQFTSNWEEIKNNRFDLIYQAVVMQHIPIQDMIHKLIFISMISPYFYSVTRCYNDYMRDFENSMFGANIACLIESTNLFEVVESSIPIEEAKSKMDETHYSVLYRSKIFKK